jgi:hypothetical protein
MDETGNFAEEEEPDRGGEDSVEWDLLLVSEETEEEEEEEEEEGGTRQKSLLSGAV